MLLFHNLFNTKVLYKPIILYNNNTRVLSMFFNRKHQEVLTFYILITRDLFYAFWARHKND